MTGNSDLMQPKKGTAYYHLPGLFEFYELYSIFLPLFRKHREYFYDWCEIGSLYGAPADCIWGGGRVGAEICNPRAALALTREYGISARLTFSNSLLRKEHLADPRCNALCHLFEESPGPRNGVIVHSDLLLDYIGRTYPKLYLVSSTTKVLTCFHQLEREVNREAFLYVVPDFRLNKAFSQLGVLSGQQKAKLSFCATNAAGLAAGTESNAMKRSAEKFWAKTAPSITALRRTPGRAIVFPRPWRTPGSSA